jgi:diguanylate cyclase (GGDEF)-like protein
MWGKNMSAISEKPVVLERETVEDPLEGISSIRKPDTVSRFTAQKGQLQDTSIEYDNRTLRILFTGTYKRMYEMKMKAMDKKNTPSLAFTLKNDSNPEQQYDSDIVLIDFSSSDKSGIEAFHYFHEYSNLPIVILTDSTNERHARQAVRAGAQDYIIDETIDASLFIRILRNAIERNKIIRSLEKTRKLERYLAYHDPLTRLPNRSLFFDRLVQSVAQARRTGKSMAVLFMDLDGFKMVNDTLGHGAGDFLLITTAERITKCIRESETAARLGGDEFGVILSEISREQDAAIVAHRILETVGEPVQLAEREYFINTSIGISLFPSDGDDPKSLVTNADTAMYRSKAEGGQRYRFFTSDIDTDLILHPVHEMNIRKAIENGEFTILFQPQIDLASGKTVSVESLVRWNHPDIGMLSPDKFIPAAEKSGIINRLGTLVLRKTCELASGWHTNNRVGVAVNVSVCQIEQPDFISTVYSILENSIKPQLLTLEISETGTLTRTNNLINKIKIIKKMGVQLAIDDFGTGYAALSYLKYIPADFLKIDSSFLSGISADAEDRAIVRALIAMAHSLSMRVIAEGVETEAQLTVLRQLGCDYAQGYYFSEPLPENQLQHFLLE